MRDSDSDSSDSMITGNAIIDDIIIPNRHLFENGFFVPRSIRVHENRASIDVLAFAGKKVDLFWTTEGLFVIKRVKS